MQCTLAESRRGASVKSMRGSRGSSKVKPSTRGRPRAAGSRSQKSRSKRKRSWGSDEGSDDAKETYGLGAEDEEDLQIAKNISF